MTDRTTMLGWSNGKLPHRLWCSLVGHVVGGRSYGDDRALLFKCHRCGHSVSVWPMDENIEGQRMDFTYCDEPPMEAGRPTRREPT